ncbi:PAS domain S-box protein [Halorubrum sp. RMP-47]|uniref:PAS domain S-box protein n=1 Tax=Halorubrum miltondacostae TaxID=3076378 RepID=UPI003529CC14
MTESPPTEMILESVLDTTVDVALLLDSDSCIVEELQNNSDKFLFHHDGEDLVGEAFCDVFRSSQIDQVCATVQEVLSCGEAQPVETPVDVGGKTKPVVSTVSPVGGEDPCFALLTIEDATQKAGGQQARDLLSRVFKVAPVGIVIVEASGDISRANERAEEILGLERSEITSRTYQNQKWDITYADGTPITVSEHPVTRVLQSGDPVVGLEHWIEQPDGSKKWLSSHSTPVFDEEGDVERVVVGLDDITHVKTREERLEWLVKSEELADIGGWELDPETDTIRGTAGLSQLDIHGGYPLSLDDVVALYHPDDRQDVRDAITACREDGTSFEVEARRQTGDGYERWVRIAGERVDKNGEQKIRGVLRDVTLDKEREQRLTVMNRALRHNIRNRANVVLGHAEMVTDELERLDVPEQIESRCEELLDSLRQASKENPNLQPEVRQLEELLTHLSHDSVGRAKTSMKKIKSASTDLTELSEKVRDFDDAIDCIGAAHSVELRSVIETLVTEHSKNHPEAEIHVTADDVTVTGNREVLRVLLQIPIDNAFKHCDTPELTVSVTAATSAEDRAVVIIEDDGPGLPEAEKRLIQGARETPTAHSMGVGLWTVQWLIRRIGGAVSVMENAHGGTTVKLELPRSFDSKQTLSAK